MRMRMRMRTRAETPPEEPLSPLSPPPPPPPPLSAHHPSGNDEDALVDELLAKIERQAMRIAELERSSVGVMEEEEPPSMVSASSAASGDTRASVERACDALRGRVAKQAREIDELRRKLALVSSSSKAKQSASATANAEQSAVGVVTEAYVRELEEGVPDAPTRELSRLRAELRDARESNARVARELKAVRVAHDKLRGDVVHVSGMLSGGDDAAAAAPATRYDVGAVLRQVAESHLKASQEQADRREALLLKTKRLLDRALAQREEMERALAADAGGVTSPPPPPPPPPPESEYEYERPATDFELVEDLERLMSRALSESRAKAGAGDGGDDVIAGAGIIDADSLQATLDAFPRRDVLPDTFFVLSSLVAEVRLVDELHLELSARVAQDDDAVRLACDLFSTASDRLGVPPSRRRASPRSVGEAVDVLGGLALSLLGPLDHPDPV